MCMAVKRHGDLLLLVRGEIPLEQENQTLYIPMGVKPENEIFSGFGKKQLIQSVIGSFGAGVVSFVSWIIAKNVATPIVILLVGVIGSVMMTTKDHSNLSVVDQVIHMVKFYRRQKIFPYRYGDEWGMTKNKVVGVAEEKRSERIFISVCKRITHLYGIAKKEASRLCRWK
jgi:hypothetical protein